MVHKPKKRGSYYGDTISYDAPILLNNREKTLRHKEFNNLRK